MRRIFCFHKSNSGEIARSRLKLVLVSDQSGFSPGLIDGIREEMIRILSRHVEIDSKRIDIRLAQMECAGTKEPVPILSAKVPFRRLTNMRND